MLLLDATQKDSANASTGNMVASPNWHQEFESVHEQTLAEIRRLASVEEKDALLVRLLFFSHLGARQAFPWRDPRTLLSPLLQGMKLCHLIRGRG